MKVLITGITGFIGANLASKLVSENCVVAGLVRPENENNNKDLYAYDGTYKSVKKAIDQFNPHVIINLAASYSAQSFDAIDNIVNTNISLPFFLFEATKGKNIKIVCAGSYWQFGNQSDSTALDTYAASKTAVESVIEYYSIRENAIAVVLYLYGTYGSNDKRGKLLDYILQSINRGDKLELSPSEQRLNLVHVDDIIRAIQIIVNDENLISGEVHKFGVFSDTSYTIKELVSICQEFHSEPFDVEFGAVSYREKELMEPQYPFPAIPGWHEEIILVDYIKSFLMQ